MYTSFSDQFLFIKSNKTAGTSIEIALSSCLADRDKQFFTPLVFEDELLRIHHSGVSFSADIPSIFHGNKAQTFPLTNLNYFFKSLGLSKEIFQFFISKRSKSNLHVLEKLHNLNAKNFVEKTGFYNHIPYSSCLHNDYNFSDFYSCVFARHPYKRFLSFIFYRSRYVRNLHSWASQDWREFALSHVDDFCRRNLVYYSKDFVTDKSISIVLSFENLQKSTNIMCERLKLPPDSLYKAMPRTKYKSSRSLRNISRDDILTSDVRNKLLRSECSLFEGLGYQDSLDIFNPAQTSFVME